MDGRKLISIPYDGPQKQLVEITRAERWSTKEFADVLRQTKFSRLYEGDILRVKVSISDKECWAETKDAVMRWGEKLKVWVYSVVPVMEKATQRAQLGDVSVKSESEEFSAFCKSRNLSESVAKTGRFLMGKS